MSNDFRAVPVHPQAGPSRPHSPLRNIHTATSDHPSQQIFASQAEEYDDLLIGLGSDDMNDFGLDEDMDSQSPPQIAPTKGGRGIDVFDGKGPSVKPSLRV